MIERFSEAMGAALVGNSFSQIPSNFIQGGGGGGGGSGSDFALKKKVTRRGPKFTKHWNLVDSWTESVSQVWISNLVNATLKSKLWVIT